jgi:hypothetical protein
MQTVDDPAERCLALSHADYGLLQNIDSGRVLNGLSQKWPVETVGALGNGDKQYSLLWMQGCVSLANMTRP